MSPNRFTFLLGLFVAFQACLRPSSPAGPPELPRDDLEALAATVADVRADAEAYGPLARAACHLIPPDLDSDEPGWRRRYCLGGLDAIEVQLRLADELLGDAQACREALDADCLQRSCTSARRLRDTLEQLRGSRP